VKGRDFNTERSESPTSQSKGICLLNQHFCDILCCFSLQDHKCWLLSDATWTKQINQVL